MEKIYFLQLKILFFVLLVWTGNIAVNAQVQEASNHLNLKSERGMKPLKKILKDFEKHYDINFVYEQSLIDGKYVSENAISYSKSVEEGLNQLLSKINLRYKKIDTKLFVIQRLDEIAQSLESNSKNGAVQTTEVNEFVITGNVVDEKGEGIPGVSIRLVAMGGVKILG